MLMECAPLKRLLAFCVPLLALLLARTALGCDQPSTIHEATPDEIRAFFEGKPMRVLTFLGYSSAGYESPVAMLAHATRVLDEFDPRTTIVNIGATPEGIGAVYEPAKRRGFVTAGSSRPKPRNTTSDCRPASTSSSS
jgi:hypothetical protein